MPNPEHVPQIGDDPMMIAFKKIKRLSSKTFICPNMPTPLQQPMQDNLIRAWTLYFAFITNHLYRMGNCLPILTALQFDPHGNINAAREEVAHAITQLRDAGYTNAVTDNVMTHMTNDNILKMLPSSDLTKHQNTKNGRKIRKCSWCVTPQETREDSKTK